MPQQSSLYTWDEVQQAIDILKRGGVVAFPTDTVFGIGASALIDEAIARLYAIKERPPNKPIPLLIADKEDMTLVAASVPELAWRLAEAFFPGGLTIVLHARPSLPKILTAGGNSVALRVPNHPVPLALIRGLGSPLAATSANLSGRPAATSSPEVRNQLGARVDMIVEGVCFGGVESTVVDLTGSQPRILREGAIPSQTIEKACQITV